MSTVIASSIPTYNNLSPIELLNKSIQTLDDSTVPVENEKEKLKELLTRFNEGKLHLAVLGQFKRGKSTFLNCLIGKKILPSSVIPLTAIPTFLIYSEQPFLRIIFENENKQPEIVKTNIDNIETLIENYVTEEKNPENKLGISFVEVHLPSELLKQGLVLIDTPGIGSTFTHNTETTLNFLPQCDAAFFVVSPDPPITEVEVDFLKEVSKKVPRIFFILNKIDYLSSKEELDKIYEFFKKMLSEKLKIENAEIYLLSAKLALEGDEENSRINELKKALQEFIYKEKDKTLQKAIIIKSINLLNEVLLEINLTIRSLTLPLEELEEKINLFEQKVDEIKEEITIAQDVLKGDQKRLLEKLDEKSDELEKTSIQHFFNRIKDDFENSEKILENEIPIYFEKEFGNFTRYFNKLVSETLKKHQIRADKLISSIREASAKIFDIPYKAPESVGVFELKQKPYWVKSKWYTPLLESIFDTIKAAILPAPLKRKMKEKKIKEHISQIISNNIANIHWSILQSINDSFRSFSSALNERLEETIEATKGAINIAIKKRKEQTTKVEDEVKKLKKDAETLEQIIKNLSEFS